VGAVPLSGAASKAGGQLKTENVICGLETGIPSKRRIDEKKAR
jgi:hypothetical protein